MNLGNKLRLWQEQKLITADQAAAILSFEESRGGHGLSWLLAAISLFCIGLGLISVVAANWDIIPPAVKIGADLTALAAVGFLIIWYFDHKETFKLEGLILTQALLILASIGLVAQIYQLQPEGLRAFLLWSGLTLPLMLLSQKRILPALWWPVAAVSLWDQLGYLGRFNDFLDWLEQSLRGGAFYFALLSAAIVFALLRRFLSEKKPNLVITAGWWLAAFISISVAFLDWDAVALSWTDPHKTAEWSVILTLALPTILLLWLELRRGGNILIGAVPAIILGFLLLSPQAGNAKLMFQLWGLGLSLTVLLAVMFFAFQKGCSRILNLCAALIGLRLLGVYLQVFGSLLLTGAGLIGAGAVVLILTILWRKLRFWRKSSSRSKECQNGIC